MSDTRVAAGLCELPIEVMQMIGYEMGLEPRDVLSLVLANKRVYRMLLGEVGEEDAFDCAQFRALGGVRSCVERGWWRAGMLAWKRGYGDMFEEWRVWDEDADEEVKMDVLCVVAGNGPLWFVRALVEDPNIAAAKWDKRVVRMAGEGRGDVEVVQLLLETGRGDPSYEHNRALSSAAKDGCLDLVEVLLADERVDPRMSYALLAACMCQRVEVLKLLVEDGRVDVTEKDNRWLKHAEKEGWEDVVSVLRAAGADE